MIVNSIEMSMTEAEDSPVRENVAFTAMVKTMTREEQVVFMRMTAAYVEFIGTILQRTPFDANDLFSQPLPFYGVTKSDIEA